LTQRYQRTKILNWHSRITAQNRNEPIVYRRSVCWGLVSTVPAASAPPGVHSWTSPVTTSTEQSQHQRPPKDLIKIKSKSDNNGTA